MEYKDFLCKLSSPARRALDYAGIYGFEKLASLTQQELLSMHGIGSKSLPIIIESLNSVGMKLRE